MGSHQQQSQELPVDIRYQVRDPIPELVMTHILSLSQTSWRFLIRRCECRLCEFFLGSWLTEHSPSNSHSEASISWHPESLLLSRLFTTVWTSSISVGRRYSLHSQLPDSFNKPLLAPPSLVQLEVSLVRRISRYSTLIHSAILGRYYTFRDAFDLVSTVTAPCGETTILNVNSELRVNNAANPGGSGYIATDSVRLIVSICVSLLNLSFSHRSMARSSRYVIWWL